MKHTIALVVELESDRPFANLNTVIGRVESDIECLLDIGTFDDLDEGPGMRLVSVYEVLDLGSQT